MAGSSAFIYTARSIEFTVAGERFDVSEAVMTLAVSAIPEVEVSIAPEKSSPGSANIHNMSISSLSASLNDLLKKSEDLVECTLVASLEKHDASSGSVVGVDEIRLERWILVSAGLDDLTTTNSFYMKAMIRHPIYRLTLYGGFWTNLDCKPNLHEDEIQSASDLIDAGIKGYEQLNTALQQKTLHRPTTGRTIPPTLLSPEAIMEIVKNKFLGVPGLIARYLAWTPSLGGGVYGFPCWSCFNDNQKKAMKELCATTWLYAEGGCEHSVWDAFMSLISTMDCVLVPEFWKEQLPVCPRFPWMPVDFGVKEDDTYLLSLPGADPNPIFGLSGTPCTTGGNDDRIISYDYNRAQLNESESDATSFAFIPEASYNSNGKFMSVSMPGWLSAVLSKGAGYNNQIDTYPDMEGDVTETPPPAVENEATQCKNDAEMLYLSSVYSKVFKQQVEARVNCKFTPKVNDSSWVIPTKVMSFEAEGKPVFEGYITSIVHNISMVNSNAVTNIACAHCRPPGGYEMTNEYAYKHPTFAW